MDEKGEHIYDHPEISRPKASACQRCSVAQGSQTQERGYIKLSPGHSHLKDLLMLVRRSGVSGSRIREGRKRVDGKMINRKVCNSIFLQCQNDKRFYRKESFIWWQYRALARNMQEQGVLTALLMAQGLFCCTHLERLDAPTSTTTSTLFEWRS